MPRDVKTYFGLSYAGHQVVPRVLATNMPADWQERFVDLMEDLDAAYESTSTPPGYDVRPADWKAVSELTETERAAAGITMEAPGDEFRYFGADGRELESYEQVAVPVDDPLPHYRHGRVTPDLDAIQAVRARRAGGGWS